MNEKRQTLRLDKWLWHARFVKSRALAVKLIEGAGVRVNTNRITKPGYSVSEGDVLTFALGDRVVVARILVLSNRRGPATEAQALYEDLSPPRVQMDISCPQAIPGGRPEKRERRRFVTARSQTLD
ncbi:MAG: RNA-binding S4 domain-containing protein [Roseinatronobacter sp.]